MGAVHLLRPICAMSLLGVMFRRRDRKGLKVRMWLPDHTQVTTQTSSPPRLRKEQMHLYNYIGAINRQELLKLRQNDYVGDGHPS